MSGTSLLSSTLRRAAGLARRFRRLCTAEVTHSRLMRSRSAYNLRLRTSSSPRMTSALISYTW
eukprot:113511-Pyramimonas_sp.AAC.1